jgi:predicted DsbA family dithiol-disulfide isomerase
MLMGDVSLLLAFSAGALSFAAPCVLPLVPAYLGYLGGQVVNREDRVVSRWTTFSHGVFFVLGFSAVFVGLGAAASGIGRLMYNNRPILMKLGGAVIVVFGLHTLGIVEFSDYQCPYCAGYVANTWPQIKSEFINTGRVRYIFKDYPLSGLHPRAPQAHAAARCAGDQGAYWGMHDRLFGGQSEWSGGSDPGAVFEGFATDLGLEANSFQICLESDRWNDAVDRDVSEGASLGVRGTPTFFVNGYPLVGARPFEFFEQVVELAEEGTLGEAYQRNP